MFIIGHRGACALEPENTLRSLQRAIDLGVDMVEIDIHQHEGKLIVLHDDRLERTTSGQGRYTDYSVRQLRELDAGKGEKIPFLGEVLALTRGKVELNIEIKGSHVVDLLYQTVRQESDQSGLLISSYDRPQLRAFHELSPGTRLGILGHHPFQLASELQAYSVHPSLVRLSETYMRHARAGGLKVYCHTVRIDQDWDLVRRFKVDGCFVDDPSVYRAFE